MLLGAPKSFIFQFDGSTFHVAPNIQVTHLTSGSLSHLLDQLATYGNIVVKLDKFIHAVSTGNCYHDNITKSLSHRGVCQTYQAYAASLASYLIGFKRQIGCIEKSVLEQG